MDWSKPCKFRIAWVFIIVLVSYSIISFYSLRNDESNLRIATARLCRWIILSYTQISERVSRILFSTLQKSCTNVCCQISTWNTNTAHNVSKISLLCLLCDAINRSQALTPSKGWGLRSYTMLILTIHIPDWIYFRRILMDSLVVQMSMTSLPYRFTQRG